MRAVRTEVAFRGAVTRAPWWALLGSAGTTLGVALCATEAWATGVILILIAAPVALANMWWFAAKPVRLSANADGVWFGGGQRVPWREIRSIKLHVVQVPEAGHLVLAFRFRDRLRSLPRVPWWLRMRPAHAGDIDFGAGVFERDLPCIAQRLLSAKSEHPAALVDDEARDPREHRHVAEQERRPA